MTLEEALVEVWRQALAEGAGEKGKLEIRRQKLESGGKYAEWRVVGGERREGEKGGAKRDSSLRRPGASRGRWGKEKRRAASLGRPGGGKSVREGNRDKDEGVFPVGIS